MCDGGQGNVSGAGLHGSLDRATRVPPHQAVRSMSSPLDPAWTAARGRGQLCRGVGHEVHEPGLQDAVTHSQPDHE